MRQPDRDGPESLFLMGSPRICGVAMSGVKVVRRGRPLDERARQPAPKTSRHRLLLRCHYLERVAGHPIGRADEQPFGDCSATRFAKKRVDVALRNPVLLVVVLCLDRDEAPS